MEICWKTANQEENGVKNKATPDEAGLFETGADVFPPFRWYWSCYINNIISHLHNFGKYATPQLTKYLHNNK